MATLRYNYHDGVIHSFAFCACYFIEVNVLVVIKRLLFYYRNVYILVFYHVFVCSLLLR